MGWCTETQASGLWLTFESDRESDEEDSDAEEADNDQNDGDHYQLIKISIGMCRGLTARVHQM